MSAPGEGPHKVGIDTARMPSAADTRELAEGGMTGGGGGGTMSRPGVEQLQLQFEIDQLNAAYTSALDDKRFDAWPDFFVEEGRYTVQARENFDRGLPLALMDLESRGMMKDRVYGITQTIYHAPYYMRHIISPAQVRVSDAGVITAQSNYAVFRTRPAGVSEVYNVGRYVDELVATGEGLKFLRRLCVYDSEMILNSLIYPV